MAIEVLPYSSTYEQAVLSLAEEILCREYGVQGDLADEDDLSNIAAAYTRPENLFLTALESDVLVGTGGVLHLTGPDCELRRLYVRADHRRQGVASAIVGALLDFVRERGYKRILLEIRPEMKETIKAYARYGFAPETGDLPRVGEFLAIRFGP